MINQTQESKLKTILLGTPEQREKRANELENQVINSNILKHIARTFLQPGYMFITAIYKDESKKEKALRIAMGAYTTILQAGITYEISNKLGEYFAK